MITTLETNTLFHNYGTRELAMVRGEGPYLFDTEGKRYLDFTAGIAVCSLGHAHPGAVAVLKQQAETLWHTSNLFLVPGQVELASKLAILSKLPDAKAMFVNTGTEANEAALKLARRYQLLYGGSPTRTKILSLPGAFHGRTMGALSMTPKPAYHEGFQPLVPDCISPETFDAVLEAIDEDVAACIVEIVQGEAGVHPVDTSFLQELAARLRQCGALLIVDEVQTGVGRTGSFYGYEQVGIQPDIVTMAKGLGNGFPVGAVVAKGAVAQAFTPGAHGSTFGGNPLAMAVGNYVVDTVSQPEFLAHVQTMGRHLQKILESFANNVTGRGLMWGFDVPDAGLFLERAANHGLLVTKCGPKRIRVVPPLIITEEHIDEFANTINLIK
ncbi:aspartate aminotransferase family protein [Alicyclobacillus dauci]|uniref:Acetylornithine/succinylornithine family transaminase n=1 Tax=Alicyclobacillus dauci TaxID=1475485 RepID=A0ABY6YZQ3_9BACL|nr:acetylornithine/succinylornithine family transaminase [Alicyclobacillus dauci]WAH35564.1 acetylornithine/succinylornithine family transaminase [Alicyclobacillus dauci]